MIFRGRVHRFGSHIDTDVIIPNRFLVASSEPEDLARGCFANVYPGFVGSVRPGDVIVAEENFGCGSSREHAPIAIKAAGIACVVASSFARIFFRSAINIGLPAIVCPEAVSCAASGDEAVVDLTSGQITVGGQRFAIPAFPPDILAILEAGGLVGLMHRRLQERRRTMEEAR